MQILFLAFVIALLISGLTTLPLRWAVLRLGVIDRPK